MPQAFSILSWLVTYRYSIAFPLAIVEGPIVMMISGFLVRTGFFDFWPIYLTLIAGDLTGDIIWYWVGRAGARGLIQKYGRFLSITNEQIDRAEKFFHTHHGKILFFSKITMGFGFALATLIAAGAAKVPFKKYLAINFFGEFLWAAVLFAIGYFLGNVYTSIDTGFRWMFIIATVVIVAAAFYGFGVFMRKRFRDTI